jgi:hypothetical protein
MNNIPYKPYNEMELIRNITFDRMRSITMANVRALRR